MNVISVDLRRIGDVENTLEDAGVVIHLAATVSVVKSVEDPLLVAESNVIGTVNTLNACVKKRVKRMADTTKAKAQLGLRAQGYA